MDNKNQKARDVKKATQLSLAQSFARSKKRQEEKSLQDQQSINKESRRIQSKDINKNEQISANRFFLDKAPSQVPQDNSVKKSFFPIFNISQKLLNPQPSQPKAKKTYPFQIKVPLLRKSQIKKQSRNFSVGKGTQSNLDKYIQNKRSQKHSIRQQLKPSCSDQPRQVDIDWNAVNKMFIRKDESKRTNFFNSRKRRTHQRMNRMSSTSEPSSQVLQREPSDCFIIKRRTRKGSLKDIMEIETVIVREQNQGQSFQLSYKLMRTHFPDTVKAMMQSFL